MKRTLVVVAAVVGFAAAASASTLTVFTTNSSNVAQSTFLVGDTILLKVTGDSQGGSERGGVFGELHFNGGIVSEVSAVQGNWYQTHLNNGVVPGPSDGLVNALNQTDPRNAGVSIDTSVITLVATAVGVSPTSWGGTFLQFFDIYTSSPGSVPTNFSFEVIVPEPATAGLVGLGLLALAFGGRRRA